MGRGFFIARCEVLSSGDLELVDSDAGEVLDEFGSDGHLEFLGEELDAVLGTGIVKEKREGKGKKKGEEGKERFHGLFFFHAGRAFPGSGEGVAVGEGKVGLNAVGATTQVFYLERALCKAGVGVTPIGQFDNGRAVLGRVGYGVAVFVVVFVDCHHIVSHVLQEVDGFTQFAAHEVNPEVLGFAIGLVVG